MAKHHENYKELIWALAKTDFKLRYHGSVLGYVWAILSPLLIFSILNFVFSSIFARGAGIQHYALQLIVSLMIFFFFVEGTNAGMKSLLTKSALVTKIYVPKWTIIIASTVNSALIFSMNLIVIVGFFIWKGFMPSIPSIALFIAFSLVVYVIILGFSLLTAPLYAKYRDLGMIWEVLTRAMFYAIPIIYPLQMLPEYIQRISLANPLAFIIHFNKEALINDHFPDPWQSFTFFVTVLVVFIMCILSYRKFAPGVAEDI